MSKEKKKESKGGESSPTFAQTIYKVGAHYFKDKFYAQKFANRTKGKLEEIKPSK